MKRKSRIKKSRTLADIRHIPKCVRNKLGFTCEVVEFSYKLLTYFIGGSKEVDSMSVRSTSCIPEIGRNAVTEWQE